MDKSRTRKAMKHLLRAKELLNFGNNSGFGDIVYIKEFLMNGKKTHGVQGDDISEYKLTLVPQEKLTDNKMVCKVKSLIAHTIGGEIIDKQDLVNKKVTFKYEHNTWVLADDADKHAGSGWVCRNDELPFHGYTWESRKSFEDLYTFSDHIVISDEEPPVAQTSKTIHDSGKYIDTILQVEKMIKGKMYHVQLANGTKKSIQLDERVLREHPELKGLLDLEDDEKNQMKVDQPCHDDRNGYIYWREYLRTYFDEIESIAIKNDNTMPGIDRCLIFFQGRTDEVLYRIKILSTTERSLLTFIPCIHKENQVKANPMIYMLKMPEDYDRDVNKIVTVGGMKVKMVNRFRNGAYQVELRNDDGTLVKEYMGEYMWTSEDDPGFERRNVQLTNGLAIVSKLSQCGLPYQTGEKNKWYLHSMWNEEDIRQVIRIATAEDHEDEPMDIMNPGNHAVSDEAKAFRKNIQMQQYIVHNDGIKQKFYAVFNRNTKKVYENKRRSEIEYDWLKKIYDPEIQSSFKLPIPAGMPALRTEEEIAQDELDFEQWNETSKSKIQKDKKKRKAVDDLLASFEVTN
jgi:hypothetical protein